MVDCVERIKKYILDHVTAHAGHVEIPKQFQLNKESREKLIIKKLCTYLRY